MCTLVSDVLHRRWLHPTWHELYVSTGHYSNIRKKVLSRPRIPGTLQLSLREIPASSSKRPTHFFFTTANKYGKADFSLCAHSRPVSPLPAMALPSGPSLLPNLFSLSGSGMLSNRNAGRRNRAVFPTPLFRARKLLVCILR